jgi:hypothetical protein
MTSIIRPNTRLQTNNQVRAILTRQPAESTHERLIE